MWRFRGVSTTGSSGAKGSLRQFFLPVIPGIVPCRCLSARLFSHHIITEGNSERCQRFTAPDLRQVVHHDFKTLHIKLQKVEVHMQTVMAIVDFADHQLKRRPLVGRQNAIAQFMPPFFQRDALFFRGKRAQIVTRDVILRRCRRIRCCPSASTTIRNISWRAMSWFHAFSSMARSNSSWRFIPLKTGRDSDAAIANEVGSPQPVGVLNGRQREGRITLVASCRNTSGCEAAGVASGLEQISCVSP